MASPEQAHSDHRITADYDSLMDVMYVMLNPIVPTEGDGIAGGVELDYSLDAGGKHILQGHVR